MSINRILHSLIALSATIVFIILCQQQASAESIVYTSTVPTSRTNWSNGFVFPQFDSNVGILTSVEISSTSEMSGSIRYENTTSQVITVSGAVEGNVLVNLPNSRSLLVAGKVFSGTSVAQPFDQPPDSIPDFSGPSSGRFEYSNAISNSITLLAASDITPFVGTGTIQLPVSANSGWSASGGSANFALLLVNVADADAWLRYTYEIPKVEIEKLVNGQLADGANDSDVPMLTPGSTVTWTYLVTNTGAITIPLSVITVTDSQPGVLPIRDASSDLGNDGLLAPDESWRYLASAIVQNLEAPSTPVTIVPGCNPTQSPAPGERESYRNIGTVIVPGFTISDPAHYCNPPRPAIEIIKLTNGADANNANGADVPEIAAGASVTWSYRVTNTGNITFSLAQVNVSDSHLSIIPQRDPISDLGSDQLLSPGEGWRYFAVRQAADLASAPQGMTIVSGCNPAGTITPGERPTYENIGFVTVPGASDNDSSHYCNPWNPGIEIVKLTNGFDANNANGADVPEIAAGASVRWSYLVTNTGNMTFSLAQVNVSDSHLSIIPQRDPTSDLGSDQLLSPGEGWRYFAVRQAADLASAPQGMTIVSGCNAAGTVTPGERPTYENIGFVTVPGASDNDPSHYCNPWNPGIEIVKLTNGFDANNANGADVPEITAGASVRWSYLVTNTGNMTFSLAQVNVSDSHLSIIPQRDPTSDLGNDQLLSPGEGWRYFAVGQAADLASAPQGMTIVSGCNSAGTVTPGERPTYENIGFVTVPGASDNDPSHYCNPGNPGIEIVKLTNGFDANQPNDTDVPQLAVGSSVLWTYLITNTGDVPFAVYQVVVTDSQRSIVPLRVLLSDVNADGILSPGESWRYIALGTVENLRQPATQIERVMGCNPNQTTTPGERPAYHNIGMVSVPGANDSDPSHYCNLPIAAIHIENTVYGSYDGGAKCPGTEQWIDLFNADVTYCFEITNTGDTYLNQLQFADPALGITLTHLTQISGTLFLAPGETVVFYYQSNIPDVYLVNLAYVEANPVDEQARDIPNLGNVVDTDPSEVGPAPTDSETSEEPARRIFLPLVAG